MRAAQAGDRARYAALLTAVIPPLRRAARARWPSAGAPEIEDIVQETLLALHNARHLYDPERPFLPFLLGIMRFRGADVLRRHRRTAARETALKDLPETSAAFATKSTQEETLDARALHAALARLPPGQRKAIEMMKLKEMSLAEAAAQTGTSVSALKVATHRGMKALRRLIEGPH
ncbi:MAG: sigma-70 family RNA polymerase sigma factor [Rhodospirillales bacterium]|nr:sigma-70 family RNA polymerase sigma factor [Rhodospirillales bacterium]